MMDQNALTETWRVDEEAPDLIVDGIDRTIAVATSHSFEGDKGKREGKAWDNARRIIACVKVFEGISTETIEAMTPGGNIATSLLQAYLDEIARLQAQVQKAHENFRKFNSIIEEEGVVQSCINAYEDIRIAIRHLKKRAETAEAKLAEPNMQPGQVVRVNNARYHGEGIVESTHGPSSPVVAVRLENDNVWRYEAETVKPIDAKELFENHWINRRRLPAAHETVLNEIADGLGLLRQEEAKSVVEWSSALVTAGLRCVPSAPVRTVIDPLKNPGVCGCPIEPGVTTCSGHDDAEPLA